jgi:hypothetical protein
VFIDKLAVQLEVAIEGPLRQQHKLTLVPYLTILFRSFYHIALLAFFRPPSRSFHYARSVGLVC